MLNDHYQQYFICLTEEELGSSEESGKDWSDLEREAAEEDDERGDYGANQDPRKIKGGKPSSPSKDR